MRLVHALHLADGNAGRLFRQNMQPFFHGLYGNIRVKPVRHGNDHSIDTAAFQQCLCTGIAGDAGKVLFHPSQPCGVNICCSRQLQPIYLAAADGLNMGAAHVAYADNANANRIHTSRLLSGKVGHFFLSEGTP